MSHIICWPRCQVLPSEIPRRSSWGVINIPWHLTFRIGEPDATVHQPNSTPNLCLSIFLGWEVVCWVARGAQCFGYIAIPEFEMVAILWDEVSQCKFSNLNKHVCHRWHPKFSKLACFLQVRVCCPLITIPKSKKWKDLPLLCGWVFSQQFHPL